ncbi:MAG: hypothetical protein AAB728_02400 [Patescibacteria group bacterium]
MKIILVIGDTDRKDLVFITDTLRTLSLPDAIKAVRRGDIQGVHDRGLQIVREFLPVAKGILLKP